MKPPGLGGPGRNGSPPEHGRGLGIGTLHIAPALLIQAGITLVCLVLTLQLWRADLRVPINYWGDTLIQLSAIKSIADGGWVWFIERLGAPFGLPLVAFPQNLTTSSLVIKALTVVSREPGMLLNMYWLAAVVLTALNAHVSLRTLTFRSLPCWVLATLFALLPYAFYRNTAHLSLIYPFVPIFSTFAIQLTTGTFHGFRTSWGKYVLVCAVAQGFDYIYYSFFTAFLLVVATILAAASGRSRSSVRSGLAVLLVLTCSAAANLAPSIVEWVTNGKPPQTTYKNAAEAEVYGLKIRQLLSPVQPSRIALVARFGEREQQFPNENENAHTRLGTVLSLGFLGLLGSLLFQQARVPVITAAGTLMLAVLMLATVGGFGALFNLLVAPDIRAYNRIAVYIAFFSAVFLARAFDATRWQIRLMSSRSLSVATAPLLLILGVLGVLDEGQAARPLVDRYDSDASDFYAERRMVGVIEARSPSRNAIMQLPETSFPPDGGLARMLTYDHARPFLSSSRTSWSWPAFSWKRHGWYDELGKPDDATFLTKLVLSGFTGIWVDRFGYAEHDVAQLEARFAASLGQPVVGGTQNRYAFFDLSPVIRRLDSVDSDESKRNAVLRSRLLAPMLMTYERGFYDAEINGSRVHRWSMQKSSAHIRNTGDSPRTAKFRAIVQSGTSGTLIINSMANQETRMTLDAGEARPIELFLQLPAHGAQRIDFVFNGPRFAAPADARTLYFAIIDPSLADQ